MDTRGEAEEGPAISEHGMGLHRESGLLLSLLSCFCFALAVGLDAARSTRGCGLVQTDDIPARRRL